MMSGRMPSKYSVPSAAKTWRETKNYKNMDHEVKKIENNITEVQRKHPCITKIGEFLTYA